jgi:putative FmdB family regulatory protein
MPLYEYRCKACGHRFEKIQSFSAPDEKECPACQGEVERLISAPAVQFKGSGFYSTDYPSKSAAAPKASSGDGGAKDSGKSESAATSGEGGSKSGSESSASPTPTSSTPSSSSSKE